jgi:hypothetical protein
MKLADKIRKRYIEGNITQGELAREFSVDPGVIMLIVDPKEMYSGPIRREFVFPAVGVEFTKAKEAESGLELMGHWEPAIAAHSAKQKRAG